MPLWLSVFVIAAILGSACAPGSTRQETTASRSDAAPRVDKHFGLAIEGEPGNLVSLMEGGGIGPGGVREAVQHHLAVYDDRANVRPQLAVELPSTSNGTWVVRPDGTMQTTYRLRPGVTWHDGVSLGPRDFAFAITIHQDAALPIGNANAARAVRSVEPVDDLTFRVEWLKTYPFAHALVEEDFGPFPTHLLESTYLAEKDKLPNLAYWKSEFVGTGPYRVMHWEPGSHLILKAYDGFYGGRAKIENITVRFITSHQTMVANLLAGTVDGTALDVLDFGEITSVKREWEQAGLRPLVVGSPRKWRVLGPQMNPEVANPREVLDIRFRKAMLHAVDRQVMADVLFEGQSPIADTVIPTNDPRWEWVKDVVVHYGYDQRTAAQFLTELGWRRGGDGQFVTAGGDPAVLPVWVVGDPQGQQEMAIVADSWKAIGVNVEQTVVPQAQQRDRRVRASFPSFDVTSVPVAYANFTLRAYSDQCPSERNQWTGNNRGCYMNPAYDRVVDSLNAAIDPGDQRNLYRELVRIYAQDLPVLPLYFKIDSAIFRDGVVGPNVPTPGPSLAWNIADWDITR
jgi:peptide/nickel transport system substrate-binding protein